jgi:hypothetical protein
MHFDNLKGERCVGIALSFLFLYKTQIQKPFFSYFVILSYWLTKKGFLG